jgi:hypothetical protein
MASSADVRRSGQFELNSELYENVSWSHVLHVTTEISTNHTEMLSADLTRSVQIWPHAKKFLKRGSSNVCVSCSKTRARQI